MVLYQSLLHCTLGWVTKRGQFFFLLYNLRKFEINNMIKLTICTQYNTHDPGSLNNPVFEKFRKSRKEMKSTNNFLKKF